MPGQGDPAIREIQLHTGVLQGLIISAATMEVVAFFPEIEKLQAVSFCTISITCVPEAARQPHLPVPDRTFLNKSEFYIGIPVAIVAGGVCITISQDFFAGRISGLWQYEKYRRQ